MATLTVSARSDVASAAGDVDDLSREVRGLADDVESVDSVARRSGAGLDALGAAGDDIASKASKATGSLGALAGGLDAVGATGAATALQGVAIATDVASGAGDALNLVSETAVGKFAAKTAGTIASTAATVASTVATGAQTAATAALNVVMAANPIALVVIAIVALAAGLVVAYRQSETFRNIVDGAFSRAKDVVDDVVDSVENVVDWFQALPGEAEQAWTAVRDAIADKVEAAVERVGDVVDAVVDGPVAVKDVVAGAFSDMFAPIQGAIDKVEDLIAKIKSIDFPDIDIPFVGRKFGGAVLEPTVGPTVAPIPNVSITIQGAIDPVSTARQVAEILAQYGVIITPTPGWSGV